MTAYTSQTQTTLGQLCAAPLGSHKGDDLEAYGRRQSFTVTNQMFCSTDTWQVHCHHLSSQYQCISFSTSWLLPDCPCGQACITQSFSHRHNYHNKPSPDHPGGKKVPWVNTKFNPAKGAPPPPLSSMHIPSLLWCDIISCIDYGAKTFI